MPMNYFYYKIIKYKIIRILEGWVLKLVRITKVPLIQKQTITYMLLISLAITQKTSNTPIIYGYYWLSV